MIDKTTTRNLNEVRENNGSFKNDRGIELIKLQSLYSKNLKRFLVTKRLTHSIRKSKVHPPSLADPTELLSKQNIELNSVDQRVKIFRHLKHFP